jgi:hypothetical protein
MSVVMQVTFPPCAPAAARHLSIRRIISYRYDTPAIRTRAFAASAFCERRDASEDKIMAGRSG